MLHFKEASSTDQTVTQNTDLTEFPHCSETDTANNCHDLHQSLQNTDPDKTPGLGTHPLLRSWKTLSSRAEKQRESRRP